jgi:hypothetical protein
MSKRLPFKAAGKAPLSRRPRTAQSVKPDTGALTPLNFKVSREFHREFKTFAAQHSKKMVEVLQEAFALLKGENGA